MASWKFVPQAVKSSASPLLGTTEQRQVTRTALCAARNRQAESFLLLQTEISRYIPEGDVRGTINPVRDTQAFGEAKRYRIAVYITEGQDRELGRHCGQAVGER